jgi:hypothetical protein
MPSSTENNTPKLFWQGISILAAIKLVLHLLGQQAYGLHRDEYLYLSEGDHLAWGFLEVPPLVPALGKLARLLLGDTMFAVRLLPALAGIASLFILAEMVREWGGRKQAQLVAAGAFLFSPAFLGSNNLFQPVSFNQFAWLMAAFFMVKIIRYQQPRHWYALGLVAGLGFLTKYSIVFFLLSLATAFLFSAHRKQLNAPHPFLAIGLALAIAAPNLFWQYGYDWPVVRHMEELAATQLSNVGSWDFIIPQFLFHGAAIAVWAAGLWALFRWPELRPYRLLAWAFLLLLLMLYALSGKDYYTVGAYSMLFAAGGLVWERWLGDRAWLLIPAMLLLNAPIIPYGLPILPPEQMIAHGQFMREHFGLEFPLRWEDGRLHDLPQDYADMLGWDELPAKVAQLYHSLSPADQAGCLLYGGNYGQAGVINFHRKQYHLPECYSFSSSFTMWLKEDMHITCQIQLDDNWQSSSDFFSKVAIIDSIDHPLARDPGYIFLKTQPLTDLRPVWRAIVSEQKRSDGLLPAEH